LKIKKITSKNAKDYQSINGAIMRNGDNVNKMDGKE